MGKEADSYEDRETDGCQEMVANGKSDVIEAIIKPMAACLSLCLGSGWPST